MVYRSISADMKRRALQLLEDGCEIHEIADLLGLSSKSIKRWHDKYETHGGGRVDPPTFLRSRRPILSADVLEGLHELILESPELYLDEIGIWLALYHDVQISTTALHDNLRELGLTCKLMHRAAAERDHELCANWMYNILNTYGPLRNKWSFSTSPARMTGHLSGNTDVHCMAMTQFLLFH